MVLHVVSTTESCVSWIMNCALDGFLSQTSDAAYQPALKVEGRGRGGGGEGCFVSGVLASQPYR